MYRVFKHTHDTRRIVHMDVTTDYSERITMFEIPEKKIAADGSPYFQTLLVDPITIPFDLRSVGGVIVPDIQIQAEMQRLQQTVLKALVDNRALFKTAPTLDRLKAMSPVWGVVVIGGEAKWHTSNVWDTSVPKNTAVVHLVLKGVEISRSSIQPIWTVSLIRQIPEPVIDFDFGEDAVSDGDELASVHSSDVESEAEGVIHLIDRAERKRISKANARKLMQVAMDAQMAADAARDRFYAEFDLSEDESDLSDADDEHE
jgi:hypothetical protein